MSITAPHSSLNNWERWNLGSKGQSIWGIEWLRDRWRHVAP